MKYVLILIVCIGFISNGCSPVPGRYYNPIFVEPIIKYDNKLYAVFNQHINVFDKNTNQWQVIAKYDDNYELIEAYEYNITKLKTISDLFFQRKNLAEIVPIEEELKKISKQFINDNEFVTYKNNKAIVKKVDTNTTINTIELPTIEDIIKNLSLNITQSDILDVEYMAYTTKYNNWDYKKHIIAFRRDKKHVIEPYDRNVYLFDYIYLYQNQSDQWHYQLIKQPIENYHSTNFLSNALDTQEFHTISSFDGKTNHCFLSFFARENGNTKIGDSYCFVLEDNNIKLKSLFGEIYNKEYLVMLRNIYEDNINMGGYNYNYTFDEQGNMHLFYNKREDIINNNYDYFWYGYFTKENPTTPLYEQKIPWEGE